MNIFKKIQEKKDKVYAYRNKLEQDRAIKTVEQLKELKKQRIATEGRAKIYELKDREQMKLNKAKESLRKRTPTYRVVDAIKQKLKENKARSSSRFGGSGQLGNFTVGQNFSLGVDNKKR